MASSAFIVSILSSRSHYGIIGIPIFVSISGPVVSIFLEKYSCRQMTIFGALMAPRAFIVSIFSPHNQYGVIGMFVSISGPIVSIFLEKYSCRQMTISAPWWRYLSSLSASCLSPHNHYGVIGMFVSISGPVVSIFLEKYSCRQMTIFGALMASSAFIVSIFSPTVDILIITYGVIGGM